MLCLANFSFTDGFKMIILLLLRLAAFYCVQVCYFPYLQIHFRQPPYNVRSTLYPLSYCEFRPVLVILCVCTVRFL